MKTHHAGWTIFAIFALASALVFGQSFVEPAGGDGGGGGSVSGAITNLTPIAGSMYVTTAVVTNSTNFSRVFAMYTSGTGSVTNTIADLSVGYLRTTNEGWHRIEYAITYRPNVAHNGWATNAFFVSTNVGSVGTNIAGAAQLSYANRGTTNLYTVSGVYVGYLTSNTYAGLCFYTVGATGAATSTNDISFERVAFSIQAVGGGTFGGGGSSSFTTNLETLASGSLTVGTVISTQRVQVGQLEAVSNAYVSTITATNRSFFTGGLTSGGAFTNNDRTWLNERINQVDPALAATFGQLRAQTLLITNEITRPRNVPDLNAGGEFLWQSGKVYATNLAGNFFIVPTNLTSDVMYYVQITSAGFVTTVSNSANLIVRGNPATGGTFPGISTNGTTDLFLWKDSVTGFTNCQIVGPQFNLAFTGQVTGHTNPLTLLLTVSNATTTGSGAMVLSNAPIVTSPSFLTHAAHVATNGNNAYLRAASSNAVPTTNVIGVIQLAAAATLIIDGNMGNIFEVTNRLGAAMTLVLTNTWNGQEISITLIGEAAGGSSRVVTIVGNGGAAAAIADLDNFGTAIIASKAITLTNGNAVEISALPARMIQTNATKIVTRQFTY